MNLLQLTPEGIYCQVADVYLDPIQKVSKAIISHGHGDHIKAGCKNYLCTTSALPVIQYRLANPNANFQGVPYGQSIYINGVNFSFHPAGHIIGSAQIRVEYQGEVWVYTGDFKIENDGLSEEFTPVPCHHLIMESTFGLPLFRWKNQESIYAEINEWWAENKKNGITSVISAYALGKAQRLIHGLDTSIGLVVCHASIQQTHQIIRNQGIILPHTYSFNKQTQKDLIKGALVIAPPPVCEGSWINKFAPFEIASVSGWMALEKRRINGIHKKSFVLSDHADWDALNQAVEYSGAENIYTTHGYVDQFARHLSGKGYNAKVLEMNIS